MKNKTIINKFQSKQFLSVLLPIFALALQNFVIFRRHYFENFGFPWDFSQAYYGFTAFWTTLVSQEIYPQWVPFYSSGMPMDLLLQSGFHYLPLWVFPLLKLEYSINAAVAVQCLHILFGAIGMFLFLRVAFEPHRDQIYYAFLGSFLFQLFGGFYSNAQHADIIRAYCFAPWLFYVFLPPRNLDNKIPPRLLLIPILLYLLITGGYPGNVVSSALVIGIYFSSQVCFIIFSRENPRRIASLLGLVFIMVLIGVGFSFIHLGPAWLFGDYLFRSQQIGTMSVFSLGLEHLPALYLNNAVVPGEISMTSTYITLPAIVLLGFIPFHFLKKYWPMTLVLVVSSLMVLGERSFFWFLLTRFFKVLQISRFPSSDYRIFIGIVLIYFAVLSLQFLVENKISKKEFVFRTLSISFLVVQGLYISYDDLISQSVFEVIVILIITIVVVGLAVLYKHRSLQVKYLIFVLVPFIISLDANRVLPQMITWQVHPADIVYKENNWPLKEDGKLLTYRIKEQMPTSRPQRIEKLSFIDYSWEGFITGRFTMNAFMLPSMLRSNQIILDNPVYKEYMLMEWKPLFIQENAKTNNNSIDFVSIETILLDLANFESPPSVRQISYGINHIEYEVTLDSPVLMVENEIYFPGWRAILINKGEKKVIDAVGVNDIFRGWFLPAGDYKMIAYFEFPYKKFFMGITIFSGILWVIILYKCIFGEFVINKRKFSPFSKEL